MNTKRLTIILALMIALIALPVILFQGSVDAPDESESAETALDAGVATSSSEEPEEILGTTATIEVTEAENAGAAPDDETRVDAEEEPIPSIESLTEFAEDESGEADSEEPSEIAGRVLDPGGEAISGARVLLFSQRALRGQSDDAEAQSTTTNTSGAFEFRGKFAPGGLVLSATAEGFQTGRATAAPAPGETVDDILITLKPGTLLTGRVITSAGAPVPGATVQATAIASVSTLGTASGSSLQTGIAAITGPEGYFQLGFQDLGVAGFIVRSAEHGVSAFSNIVIDDSYYVELVVQEPATLTGRITFDGGAPAEGMTVSLSGQINLSLEIDGPRGRSAVQIGSAGSSFEGLIDPEGLYRIEGVGAGQDYTARILDADGSPRVENQALGEIAPGELRLWDYIIRREIRIYGHVLGQTSGQPLPGGHVISSTDGNVAQVDSEGAYEFTLLGGAGTYTFIPKHGPNSGGYSINSSDMANAVEVDLKDGEERELDLTLFEATTWTLEVLDPAGLPVPGAMIMVLEESGGRMPNMRGIGQLTDADGRITDYALKPGILTWAGVTHAGYTSGESEPVLAQLGETVEEIVVVLHPQGGLAGQLLDPNGNPFANVDAGIAVQYPDGRSFVRSVLTDGEGFFQLQHNLPEGSLQLTFGVMGAEPGSDAIHGLQLEGPIQGTPGRLLDLGQLQLQTQDSTNFIFGGTTEVEQHIEIRRELSP